MEWKNNIQAEKRDGFCLCGCGQKTKIATVTRKERNDVKGFPVRYIYGHNTKDPEWRKRVATWTRETNWKGGKTKHQGYVLRHKRSFVESEMKIIKLMFRKSGRGYILEHRALMAIKLGRPLKKDEIVRHVDGNKSNNSLENLIIGTYKDNYLDHDSARREVMRLKTENDKLKEIIKRLHGGKKAKILFEISEERLKKEVSSKGRNDVPKAQETDAG